MRRKRKAWYDVGTFDNRWFFGRQLLPWEDGDKTRNFTNQRSFNTLEKAVEVLFQAKGDSYLGCWRYIRGKRWHWWVGYEEAFQTKSKTARYRKRGRLR